MKISALLNHIAPHITLNEEEKTCFSSLWKVKKVKRKQLIEQPGFVSKNRTYVIEGALSAYFIGHDGQEHTISLAVEDWWIGDPLARFGTGADIAEVVALLVSDRGEWITGQNLHIDGGMSTIKS